MSRLVLPAHPGSVRKARDFVRAFCRSARIDGAARDTAVLLTSETVTNAFLHGRSQARLVVTYDGDLLVEVGDDDARRPSVLAGRPDASSGRGMAILDGMAASWGVLDDPPGKVVWFEVLTERP